MTDTRDGASQSNLRLEQLVAASGMSRKRLAHRVNELSASDGKSSQYTHTSVANWCRRGMIPKWPTPQLICRSLSEVLGRPVTLQDIGMPGAERNTAQLGLEFARRQEDAVTEAAAFWSAVNRRQFLTSQTFAISAFSTPMARWLIDPAEPTRARTSGPVVDREHIAELREAADSARQWDSRFGGANRMAKSLTEYLYDRVAPLLQGSYSEPVGRDLFRVTAEMARLAGFTAFDASQHDIAQRHFIQALRLARAGGDAELGSYILSTMAMQSMTRGFTSEAIDMAQGAFQRGRGLNPRVAGFAKMMEARAHARASDGRATSACIAEAERLQERADGMESPAWIGFFTQQRIVTDALEAFRDLGNHRAVFAWNATGPMPSDAFLRSRSVRLSMLASAHAQNGDLDQSLRLGRESLALFTRVGSLRGMEYLRVYSRSLESWPRDAQVVAFSADVRKAARSLAAA
ncbi:sporulation protein [Streptomyces sp. NPDC058595]|uniref:sporulation protein n=1 Tax=Streptomyces sp. NPDC058595 TaxID=3346550 RepID=UPI0036519A1C